MPIFSGHSPRTRSSISSAIGSCSASEPNMSAIRLSAIALTVTSNDAPQSRFSDARNQYTSSERGRPW